MCKKINRKEGRCMRESDGKLCFIEKESSLEGLHEKDNE